MRKEGLKSLILIRQIEVKRNRAKQHITYLASLSEWMTEQGLGEMVKRHKILRAARDRKLWRDMIANVLKEHGS